MSTRKKHASTKNDTKKHASMNKMCPPQVAKIKIGGCFSRNNKHQIESLQKLTAPMHRARKTHCKILH